LGFRLASGLAVYTDEKVPLSWDNWSCLESCKSPVKGTFKVKNSARAARVTMSADGRGLVSQAGAFLLWETMWVTGLSWPVTKPGPVAGAAGGLRPGQGHRVPSAVAGHVCPVGLSRWCGSAETG
jgi:hypothetical protein